LVKGYQLYNSLKLRQSLINWLSFIWIWSLNLPLLLKISLPPYPIPAALDDFILGKSYAILWFLHTCLISVNIIIHNLHYPLWSSESISLGKAEKLFGSWIINWMLIYLLRRWHSLRHYYYFSFILSNLL